MARRVAFGTYGTEFIGRISRPGFDAATTTQAEQLALDIGWVDLTQIVASGVAMMSGGFISHDLARVRYLASFPDMGFVPHVLVWAHALNRPPTAFMVTNTDLYVGYQAPRLNNQSATDSSFLSTWNVPFRYFITKLPIDA